MRAWAALVFFYAAPSEAEPAPLEIASDPERPTDVGRPSGPAERVSEPRRRGHFPEGLFLPVGFSVASASHPSTPSSLALGAEASLALFPFGHGNWAGVYTDVIHETKNELTRWSFGLEAGFVLVGVDGGVVMQVSDAGKAWGGVVRPMLTLAFVTLYGRFGFMKDAEDFREIGALFKFPIHLMDVDFDEPPPPPPPPRRASALR